MTRQEILAFFADRQTRWKTHDLAGTNRHFKIQGVRLFEMGHGLVQHERQLYDFTGLLIQVGVLRGKPAK